MTRVVEFHDFLFHDVLKCGREIIKKLLVFEKTCCLYFIEFGCSQRCLVNGDVWIVSSFKIRCGAGYLLIIFVAIRLLYFENALTVLMLAPLSFVFRGTEFCGCVLL